MVTPFKVAAVEFNPELFEFARNIKRACAVAEEAASNGAKLIVLQGKTLIVPSLERLMGAGLFSANYLYMDREGRQLDAIS